MIERKKREKQTQKQERWINTQMKKERKIRKKNKIKIFNAKWNSVGKEMIPRFFSKTVFSVRSFFG
jgi:hypothetical protein